jgi:CheY-like chemotaxis protein/anti-sigma regulatory factor (Ser/Thr protein kinase)
MTHELRTPLTSILGYAQLLLKSEALSGWARERVATMQRSGQHMHALIDGSLDLARIEAGRLKLDSVPMPFGAFLQDLVRMIRPQAEAKGLRFVVRHQGEMPDWIRSDAKRLRQILINLLSNAVRFTAQGEVRLLMDFRQQVARIDVEDTGIGIAQQDQKRIFLPFERGSAGRRATSAGTGLGLTITHLLVDMMGGELTLRSLPGEGSSFSLRLYLPRAEPEFERQDTPELVHHNITGYAGPPRRILVVDDQALHRQLLAGLLMPLGFTIEEAASGQECLEILERELPDLLLLDITMDGLDGWQTAQAVREHVSPQQLPIVFVSANQFDNQPDRWQPLGCQGFVGKPLMESELLDTLRTVLRLEWVRAMPHTGGLDPSGLEACAPEALPEELRGELRSLAQKGQVSGLRKRLERALLQYPDHAPTLMALKERADALDFERLQTLLSEPADPPQDVTAD